MQTSNRDNICVYNTRPIITPEQLKAQFPLTDLEKKSVNKFRNMIINIINKRDPRLLVVCGPCSIHEIDGALDYANKLKNLSIKLQKCLCIVMRVYLEKPRTNVGWKGMINDPYMNNSYDIESGLKMSRKLLLKLIKINLPLATEILSPYVPQYIEECFSWSAIGARTTESQVHREIASGLHTAIGFKNSTNGNLFNAINAVYTAMMPHNYINIGQSGKVCILHTQGNPNGHIILRGGDRPNYHLEDIIHCEKEIKQANLPLSLMIDCSHGNSKKDYRRQVDVAKSVVNHIKDGNCSIVGLMLESYIYSGSQSINFLDPAVRYGISVTDACISWEKTEYLLCNLYEELKSCIFDRFLGAKME